MEEGTGQFATLGPAGVACDAPAAECNAESTAAAMAHLTKVYIAGLLILGLFGNVYCVTAFLMPVFRRVPSTLYLAALALSDIGFLMTLGLMWMRSIGLRFLDMPHVCTTCMFLSYFCCFVSSWLVFAVTLERYLLASGNQRGCSMPCVGRTSKTNRPVIARRPTAPSSKHRRVRITFVVIIICGVLINSWVIFTADSVVAGKKAGWDGMERNGSDPEAGAPGPAICDLSEAAAGHWAFFNALDMIVSFTLPFLGVLILNAKIGFRVCKAQSIVRQQQSDLRARTSSAGNGEEETMLREPRTQNSAVGFRNGPEGSLVALDRVFQQEDLARAEERRQSTGRTVGRQRRGRREKIERKVTQLLVTVSLAYLVLNLPSYLHRVVFAFESSSWEEGPDHKNSVEIVSETIAYLMFYTQFSINFFLYSCHGCMFGFNC